MFWDMLGKAAECLEWLVVFGYLIACGYLAYILFAINWMNI